MHMPLHEWKYGSCTAHVATGVTDKKEWATIYHITSKEKGKGHAGVLLKRMKDYYETQGIFFGSSVSLNSTMSYLLKKLNIYEYTENERI